MNPLMIAVAVLGVLLAVSSTLNAWQYKEREKTLTVAATASQLAEDTKATAQACSDGVDRLARAGDANRRAIITAVDATKGQIAGLQQQALAASRAKPDNPQDLCGSLERYLKAQIKAEKGGAK